MEDLLERMLAVDQQGEALVKAAEEKALRLREENSTELAKEHTAASEALAKECQAMERQAVEAAERQRSEALDQAARRLQPRSENFSRELEGCRYKLLKELLAL